MPSRYFCELATKSGDGIGGFCPRPGVWRELLPLCAADAQTRGRAAKLRSSSSSVGTESDMWPSLYCW